MCYLQRDGRIVLTTKMWIDVLSDILTDLTKTFCVVCVCVRVRVRVRLLFFPMRLHCIALHCNAMHCVTVRSFLPGSCVTTGGPVASSGRAGRPRSCLYLELPLSRAARRWLR